MWKRDTQAPRKCTGESRFTYLEKLSTKPLSFMIWSISSLMVGKMWWVPRHRYLFWFHILVNFFRVHSGFCINIFCLKYLISFPGSSYILCLLYWAGTVIYVIPLLYRCFLKFLRPCMMILILWMWKMMITIQHIWFPILSVW